MQFQSLRDIKINRRLVFLKVLRISHVSALLGPNPFTSKVELEQETVETKEKELNCNLENKSSSFFSSGDFNNCCDFQCQ